MVMILHMLKHYTSLLDSPILHIVLQKQISLKYLINSTDNRSFSEVSEVGQCFYIKIYKVLGHFADFCWTNQRILIFHVGLVSYSEKPISLWKALKRTWWQHDKIQKLMFIDVFSHNMDWPQLSWPGAIDKPLWTKFSLWHTLCASNFHRLIMQLLCEEVFFVHDYCTSVG